MKHNEKKLQQIIDECDPHDRLLRDDITIRVAKKYAEYMVKKLIKKEEK